MIIRIGEHYDTTVQGVGSGKRISNLYCLLCHPSKRFIVWRSEVHQGKSKSGLGKFNRMRAKMVRHVHEQHLGTEAMVPPPLQMWGPVPGAL